MRAKKKIKIYKELWIKIRDLIRSIAKNWDDYVEKYMEIKLSLNDELPLNKMIEILGIFFMKIINVIHKFLKWMSA